MTRSTGFRRSVARGGTRYRSVSRWEWRVAAGADLQGAIENKVLTSHSTNSGAPTDLEHQPTWRNSYPIGICSAFLLMSWLDFRIGSTLAGPHSNQLIWALWLLVSVLLALWLAIAPGTTWLFAVCAAVLRSFEKTAVMAYCWSKYGAGHVTVIMDTDFSSRDLRFLIHLLAGTTVISYFACERH